MLDEGFKYYFVKSQVKSIILPSLLPQNLLIVMATIEKCLSLLTQKIRRAENLIKISESHHCFLCCCFLNMKG